MKFAVVTLGSAGDLHPFLAIARELVRRGHDVQLLSQAPYAQQSLAEGVPFVPVVDTATHDRTLRHPALWHPINGFGVLWRHLATPAIEPVCETLGELARQSADPLVVLASPLAVGARFAQERWPDRVRLLSGYTAPMGLRHIDDPMFLGSWRVPGWVPGAARHALWALLDHWKLEPMARPVLERWRTRWGTAPIRTSIFGDWLHSPDGGLALYPPSFATLPSEWRRRGVSQTGFPLFEPQSPSALPQEATDFIQRHPNFALIYPGSAAGAVQRFSDLVLPACEELGLPCVVLAAHLHRQSDPVLRQMKAVLKLDQARLASLLAHARVFVHHGGIGSLAQGLACQVPQLVLASAYDQFENGSRLASSGSGNWLKLDRATALQVKQSLTATLSASPQIRRRLLSDVASGAAPTERACNLLEAAASA